MTRDELREDIARFINSGWDDEEIASALPEGGGGSFGQVVKLVGVIRDLMAERTEE